MPNEGDQLQLPSSFETQCTLYCRFIEARLIVCCSCECRPRIKYQLVRRHFCMRMSPFRSPMEITQQHQERSTRRHCGCGCTDRGATATVITSGSRWPPIPPFFSMSSLTNPRLLAEANSHATHLCSFVRLPTSPIRLSVTPAN